MPITRDHPVIEAMERTGFPDGIYPKFYTCPTCETDVSLDELEYELSWRCPECDSNLHF